jgi:hypothetical protein
MALSMLPPEPDRATDDYVIEREDERAAPPVASQVVTALRMLMVAILAIASVALFWVVGTMIGLF